MLSTTTAPAPSGGSPVSALDAWVHEHDRSIPSGKVLLRECGDMGADDLRPVSVLLRSAPSKVSGRRVELRAVSAGWQVAGSMMRWDNGHVSVTTEIDGATHGKRFLSYSRALAEFRRVTLTNCGAEG